MSNSGFPPSGPGVPTTSNDYDYAPASTNIIARAYRIMGVNNELESPSAAQYADGLATLNAMIKELMATGFHIWTTEEAILFTQQYQGRYLLYEGTPEKCCDAFAWGLSSVYTPIAQGGATLVLSGQYGYSPPVFPEVGDNIGINLDTGRVFWTTISGPITGSTNLVIPLAQALPSSSSAGEFCYWFDPEDAIQRPLRVPFARRINYNVGIAGSSIGPILTPLTNMYSRQEYFALPQLQSPGDITQAFYNPARDKGEMYVWNVPQDCDQGMRFTYYRPIQNFDTVDDTADLPQEWDNALKWNLAKELAPQWDVPEARWDRITQMAALKLETVMGWDRESQSVYFGLSADQTHR